MNLVERVLSEQLSGFIHPDLGLIRTERSRADLPHVCRGAENIRHCHKTQAFPHILHHKLGENFRIQNMFLIIRGQPVTEVRIISFHLVQLALV